MGTSDINVSIVSVASVSEGLAVIVESMPEDFFSVQPVAKKQAVTTNMANMTAKVILLIIFNYIRIKYLSNFDTKVQLYFYIFLVLA